MSIFQKFFAEVSDDTKILRWTSFDDCEFIRSAPQEDCILFKKNKKVSEDSFEELRKKTLHLCVSELGVK